MQDLNTDSNNLENTLTITIIEDTEDSPSIKESNNPRQQKQPVRCKYCPKKYKVPAALKSHEDCCPRRKDTQISNATEEATEHTSNETKLKTKQNACKNCGQTFKYAKILQKHEAMHEGKFPFWCKLCMVNFATHEEKVLHKLNEHPTKGKRYKCKICQEKVFDEEEAYLLHINEIHKGKLEDYYMCSDCGKQFKTKSELTHHNNSKCGTVKQYQCKVCNQYLMTAGSLHNHMLRHTGEQGCMCWYCGKTFLTIGQLKVHERTHTQEKAFVCDVCGKGFCHRQSLITHSTLHTGIKPYQCENCGHSFSCVGNLIKHRRTHADTCGKVPLTSHRVINPSTKMKVKINTPESSKLKAVRKEKELQKKLAAYKKKLNLPDDSEGIESKQFETNSTLNSGGKVESSKLVKSENGRRANVVPYVSNNYLQAKVFETEETSFTANENYCSEPIYDKQSNNCPPNLFNNNLQVHSNEFTSKENTEIFSNWGYLSEASSEIGGYAVKHYPPDISSAVIFEDLNAPIRDYQSTKVCNASESNLCHSDAIKNENYETDDNCDNAEHQYDDDSEDCSNVKLTEGTANNEINTNYQRHGDKTTKSHVKQRQEKISEREIADFVKERGFAFKVDGTPEGTCQYCKKTYTNMRWLLRHEKEHCKKMEQTYIYKCRCCKIGFETREACKMHQQNMHADILTCQDCDKLFSNLDSLRSHQNIFHKGLPRKVYVYVCEKCGLQFRQKAFLSHHEKNNCGAGPVYECHVCGKGFNSVHTRRSHQRIHDPKKRFLCKFCGKNFRWKGQLKVHERSHTGEKPFKCLYCPKAFGYRESLVTHSSLHTGIKPHLCQACGSRFSCIGNLIKHRTTHASTCGVWYSKNQ